MDAWTPALWAALTGLSVLSKKEEKEEEEMKLGGGLLEGILEVIRDKWG